MSTKLYDIIVAVSKYKDANGNEKTKWENIGAIWENTDSNGNKYRSGTLKRTFNPAGITVQDGADSIRLTFTKPKDNRNSGGQQYSQNQQSQQQRNTNATAYAAPDFGGFDSMDGGSIEEMPF